MSESNWDKKKKIFFAALDMPQTARASFLHQNCGNDADLKNEVEKLLAAHSTNETFIEKPAFQIAATFADKHLKGKQFGNYQIIREIGRGGMGAVFLAERNDGAFKQQVALKIVRQTILDSETEKRFRRERQILASLNHPNIARLLDGGVSESGEPFLAMEYVEGKRIDEFCEEKNLSTNERLKLFQQVCSAVSFAHQNLVVHRDIKPSNILVTKDGVLKLLDFGIAKLLDAEHADEHTQTGYRAFTPEYASPEQIKGEQITTASDVYSLGVLLSHLVLGQKSKVQSPSGGNQNRKTYPQPTKTKDQRPRTELEAILHMARREEAARRYPSVQQFAEDIQRYLNGLPVRAQKDSFTYRAQKFVQRHRIGVVAAVLVVLSLIAGLAASLWQANTALQQERLAREQRDLATRRFNDVRQLSNALLFDIAPKIERVNGSTEARLALVNQSLKYLDSLAQESFDDLQLQSELASAYEKIGDLQGAPGKPNLSDFSGALSSLEKARAIRLSLLEKNPNDLTNQKRLAENFSAASYVRWWTSDISGSIKDSEKALELYEKLIAAEPNSLDLRLAAIEARINLAQTLYFNDQVSEVYAPLRTALNELETFKQSNSENAEIGRLLGKGRVLLGLNLFWDNKAAEGGAEISQAITISESIVAQNPRDNILRQGLWHVYTQSSQFYQDSKPSRSLELLNKALTLSEESIKIDSSDAQARQNLAKTYSMLGLISNRLGRLNDAVSYLEKSLAIFAELETAEPQNLTYKDDIGRNFTQLGLTKYQQRDFDGALAAYEKSVKVFEYQAKDPKNLFPQKQLAKVFDYIADAHTEAAKTTFGEERQEHLQKAGESYQRTLNILLLLESKNALAEYDRKFLEETQAAVREYEKKR
ncbi:MAG: serine/threonine-protein kinase [Acidobacteriota bacterium]|nr:serine/threonine-protein kinase [Acidobacteriota bacterium]